jgi:hypothetical protein
VVGFRQRGVALKLLDQAVIREGLAQTVPGVEGIRTIRPRIGTLSGSEMIVQS